MSATPQPAPGDAPAAPPTGFRAVEVAADGDPSPATAFNALAYFMGEEAPPGEDDLITLDMDFDRADGRKVRAAFRSLVVEELDKCEQLARTALEKHADMQNLGLGFFRWSYVFAYACQEPNLGLALNARRQAAQGRLTDATTPEEKAAAEAEMRALADTAGLVRLVFRKRPGVLQHAVFEIEGKAKLGEAGAGSVSVVEVEAGKASS